MKISLTKILLILCFLLASHWAIGQTILHVNVNATGSNNGDSWINAHTNLRDALTIANTNPSINYEIRVAAGTYYTTGTQNSTDRNISFLISRSNLKIYGGYDASTGQRNRSTNTTILSGDIGVANNATDNSHHVMVIEGINATTDSLVIDGFTIMGGYNETGGISSRSMGNTVNASDNQGGGINISNNTGGAIAISNCIISKNRSAMGGGIFNYRSSPIIRNTIFSENTANGEGGCIYNQESSAVISNCIFNENNSLGGGGGALMETQSSLAISNCIFNKNTANYHGRTLIAYSSTTTISNCIIWGNPSIGIAYNPIDGNPTIKHSIIQSGFTGLGNSDADPLFVNADNAIGPDGIWGTADDGLRLQTGSPAINAGDNNAIPSGNTTDLAGVTRIQDGTVDMGAYETVPEVLSVKLLDFSAKANGNSAIINWSTQIETNNNHFVLERSTDKANFVEIAKLVAKGSNSNYKHTDYAPAKGYNYYRLTQVDHDGTKTNYQPVSINFILGRNEVTVYPNPAMGTTVKLSFDDLKFTSLKVVNLQGQTLQSLAVDPNQTEIKIDISAYSNGIYFIVLLDNEGNKTIKKLLKQ